MATTSTVPAVKQALTAALVASATLTGVDVTYTWQPWRSTDQLFLGQVDGESTIPTMKAGRKFRQESYQFDLVIRTVDTGGSPTSGADLEARAFGWLAAVEDVLADDVQIDGTAGIQWAIVGTFQSRLEPVPETKSWGCELLVTVQVEARLS